MEYPKIETLFDRDEKTFKVITSKLRMPEFGIINRWHITEKIDGTNVRLIWNFAEQKLTFGGRTDNAQMPLPLLAYLQSAFTPEMFSEFDTDVLMFGEGYGEKIQNGGNYRKGVSFRLFDVLIGKWWLEPESIAEIAQKMNCQTVPSLGIIDELPITIEALTNITGLSATAKEDGGSNGLQPEGIVARSCPLLLTRSGHRVMWKLKYRDF